MDFDDYKLEAQSTLRKHGSCALTLGLIGWDNTSHLTIGYCFPFYDTEACINLELHSNKTHNTFNNLQQPMSHLPHPATTLCQSLLRRCMAICLRLGGLLQVLFHYLNRPMDFSEARICYLLHLPQATITALETCTYVAVFKSKIFKARITDRLNVVKRCARPEDEHRQ